MRLQSLKKMKQTAEKSPPSADISNKGILSLLSAIEQTNDLFNDFQSGARSVSDPQLSLTREEKLDLEDFYCIVCTNHDSLTVDLFEEPHQNTLLSLEGMVKRKILKEKYASRFLCQNCTNVVTDYARQSTALEKVRSSLKEQFDSNNPTAKRGRKRREIEKKTDPLTNEEGIVRKSARTKKMKVESENKTSTKDHESMFEKEKKVLTTIPSNFTDCENVQKNFPCDICGKSFIVKNDLTVHVKAHTLEKPFSCDKCDKSFKQRHSLREHVLKNHDLIKKFSCQYCQDKFASRHLLRTHERAHTGERGYICDECGEEFVTKQAMVSHKSKHNGEYQFHCKICSRGFNSKTLYYEHALIHTGEKPFQCDQCGRKFSNRGTLWAHKKQHLNAKPYQCQYCQKSFTHSSHLAVHRRIHTGERPYKCRFCVNGFVSASHLRRHMKNHTGQLPFACRQCSFAFNQMSELIKHCNEVHNGIVVMEKGVEPSSSSRDKCRIDNSSKTDTFISVSNKMDEKEYSVVNINELNEEDVQLLSLGRHRDGQGADLMVTDEVVHLSSEILQQATEINNMGETVLLVTIPEVIDEARA